MKDFWKFCAENKEAILTIGSGIATALGTALGFLIHANVVFRRKLKAAQRSCYQIRCPICKKVAPMSEVTFLLPSGKADQNLNGIPDEDE